MLFYKVQLTKQSLWSHGSVEAVCQGCVSHVHLATLDSYLCMNKNTHIYLMTQIHAL